jgi:hypothetical protein
MEVHHHSHHGKKKWTEYFWEFLMLFFAVTLGFFVENQREHYVEHQRERKYISSLIADIKTDTAELNRYIRTKEFRSNQSDTLIRLLISGRYKELGSEAYYLARILTRGTQFTNSDGTMQQLKNAGGLRLIRKQFIVDTIMKYDYQIQGLLYSVSREQLFGNRFTELTGEIFDAEVFYNMIDPASDYASRPKGNPQLLTNDRITINKVAVQAQYVATLQRLNLLRAKSLKVFAIRVIEFLQKEYHLN